MVPVLDRLFVAPPCMPGEMPFTPLGWGLMPTAIPGKTPPAAVEPGATAAGGGMSAEARVAAEESEGGVVTELLALPAGAAGGATDAKRAANARWLFASSSFTCCGVAPG